MSGVWFAVCIPTERSERKLKHRDDSKESQRNTGRGPGDTSPPAYREHISNGDVPLGESEANKRNETKNKDPHIIPPGDIKKEGLHKTKSKEAMEDKILEKRLQEALDLLGITDAVWVKNKDETHYQVYFPCEGPGLRCDFVLQTLMSRGIGEKGGSTVGIVPCAVFFNDDGQQKATEEGSDSDSDTASVGSGPEKKTEKKAKGFKAMQQEFLQSVTARLTVAQVVESVRTDANLTFDFIMFVIVASMVAALGLMENSAVVIVAAMLISPIMGPILAFTFGAMVRDIPLVLQGIRTEIVGLSICLTSGFLFGIICGNWGDTWGAGVWPTDEMYNRGMERSLWVGALIALPSGAGVALSVLGGNTASLVGVAISASLLPPTVNCGLLWGLGAIKRIRSSYETETLSFYNISTKPSLMIPYPRTPHYFTTMDKECAVLGIVSFLLTVVNIACIIIAALLILKIKEVAPNTSDSALSRFWKQDVKIARDYNRTLGQQEGDQLGKQFLKEWANLNGIDPDVMMSDTAEGKLTQFHTLMDIVEDAQQDDVYLSITRHVPALRRLSQAVNVPTWNPSPPDDEGEIPRVWDVEYGPQSRSRRSSYAPNVIMGNRPMKKRRRSKAPSISINRVAEDDGHLQPPQVSAIPRKSVVYRRSLVSADNPYSLWPSHNRGNTGSRFDVTPVDELGNVLNRPRKSRCYSTAIPNPETITTSF